MTATQFLPLTITAQALSYVRYATRSVSDGVLNSSTTVTSATAAFTSADVGASISGTGIPVNATISSVTNGTTVVISSAATATSSGVTLTIVQTATLAVGPLATALNSAFGATAGNIQCVVDQTSGKTTNALVIVNDNVVFSVPLGSWVGYNQTFPLYLGWLQFTASQMSSTFQQFYLS